MDTIKFEFDKETKNTVRFTEIETGIIGTIYVSKYYLDDNFDCDYEDIILDITIAKGVSYE